MSAKYLLIPRETRKKILVENYIIKAQPNGASSEMVYLMAVWKEYLEPGLKMDCNLCYDRVLRSFRSLQDLFIKDEQAYQLLDED
jgi:hypothetical protein